MPFIFQCPSCQANHKAQDNLAGRRVRCPQCGEAIVVPSPAEAAREATSKKARASAAQPSSPPPPTDDADANDEIVFEQSEEVEAEMDMTPMVDVTFLLLIFFMITAAFSLQKSLEIPAPKQDDPSTNAIQEDPEENTEFITVVVDEYNTYSVISPAADMDGEEAPSQQDLLRLLREARSVPDPPSKLLVKAHTDSVHEKVVAALDAGTQVGMEQVQLQTVEQID